jgi:anti-anti-sigma regulatory factor
MTTNAEWIRVDPERVLDSLQEAVDHLNRPESEVTLDFSSLPRIDAQSVLALEHLAALAADKSAKIILRAVNGDIYKVLKLLKLTDPFSFIELTTKLSAVSRQPSAGAP